jgi:hypothetical protein
VGCRPGFVGPEVVIQHCRVASSGRRVGSVQPASATLPVSKRRVGRAIRVIRVGLSLCGPWRLNWGGDAPLPWRLQDLLRSSAGGGSASSELSARRAESRRGSSSSGTAAPYPGVCRTYSGRVQGGVGRRPSPRLAHDYPAASSKATAPGKPAAAAMRTRGLSSCPGWAGKGPLRVDAGGPWELNPTRPPGGKAAGDGVGLLVLRVEHRTPCTCLGASRCPWYEWQHVRSPRCGRGARGPCLAAV